MSSITVGYGKKDWGRATRSTRNGVHYNAAIRKTLPFVVCISGMDLNDASEAFLEWCDEAAAAGADHIEDSDFDATFDEARGLYEVKVEYPKDFDLPYDSQRIAVRSSFRKAARVVSQREN